MYWKEKLGWEFGTVNTRASFHARCEAGLEDTCEEGSGHARCEAGPEDTCEEAPGRARAHTHAHEVCRTHPTVANYSYASFKI